MSAFFIPVSGGHFTNINGEENFYLPVYEGKSLVGTLVSISSYQPEQPAAPIRLRSDNQNVTDFILIAGSVCNVIQPENDVTQGHAITVRCIKSDYTQTLWQVVAREGNWQQQQL